MILINKMHLTESVVKFGFHLIFLTFKKCFDILDINTL
jgi:hypothetical protein